MSPRRSFPLAVTAPVARACGIGTASLEIQDESPLAPAGTTVLRASNDNGGDTGVWFKPPAPTLRHAIAGPWRSIS